MKYNEMVQNPEAVMVPPKSDKSSPHDIEQMRRELRYLCNLPPMPYSVITFEDNKFASQICSFQKASFNHNNRQYYTLQERAIYRWRERFFFITGLLFLIGILTATRAG